MKKRLSLLCALFLSTQVAAEQKATNQPLLDKNKFSIGVGAARNSVGSFDETGFQFFAGYDLDEVNLMDGVNTSIEMGYLDYGFSSGDDDGLWINAVVDGALSNKLGWLARAGLDLGDDSGLMVGAGVGLDLNARTTLRFEYVIRDDVDSIQFNLRYHM